MTTPKTYYLSLGSNKGDKFKNLQDAVDLIYERIGLVRLISKVYKSPALGFKSSEFLNCCLILESDLEPYDVLQKLLVIETVLGRTRNTANTYQARTIDLDVIFVGDEIIDTASLKVPHPEMQNRRFVLQPLKDLRPDLVHPKLKKEVSVLLTECSDTSLVKSINMWLKKPHKKTDFSKVNYMVIEGNIGVGKTSLARKIAHDFKGKILLERFKDNPFLPKFYNHPKRYAFTLEMSFLADRYQQISEGVSQLDLFKDFTVSDYDMFKSLIFSEITLQKEEFKLYRKLFYSMCKDLRKPDLYVYLHQDIERLLEHIKERGREYEQYINKEYLEKISQGYLNYLKNQTDLNVKIIDVSNKDFVANRADYLWVLEQISRD